MSSAWDQCEIFCFVCFHLEKIFWYEIKKNDMGHAASISSTARIDGDDVVNRYAIRVSAQLNGARQYLHFVEPMGKPVWTKNKSAYATQLSSMCKAQDLCRQVFMNNEFPIGTRVEFIKQEFVAEPSLSGGDGETRMRKLTEHLARSTTVEKPVL